MVSSAVITSMAHQRARGAVKLMATSIQQDASSRKMPAMYQRK